MAKFAVTVTQIYRVERKITLEVEGDDAASALEDIESGNQDLPPFEDPRWRTGWDLQSEESELA